MSIDTKGPRPAPAPPRITHRGPTDSIRTRYRRTMWFRRDLDGTPRHSRVDSGEFTTELRGHHTGRKRRRRAYLGLEGRLSQQDPIPVPPGSGDMSLGRAPGQRPIGASARNRGEKIGADGIQPRSIAVSSTPSPSSSRAAIDPRISTSATSSTRRSGSIRSITRSGPPHCAPNCSTVGVR